MSLKSLEKILEGIGKLRAGSAVAALVSGGALLGLNIPAGAQSAGLVATAVIIAAVNVVDGYIRGQHVSALPALIAQGAESVAKVQDPRVDAVANTVDLIAKRIESLEGRPAAPSLPEIIAGLTGRADVPAPAPAAAVVPTASQA